MRKRAVMLIFVSLLFSLIPVGAQDDLEDLRFFLPFIPNIQFSPLYVAEAEGYFADVGFALQLEYGDENVGIEQIAIGDLDFGMIGGEQVILARAGDRPVVFVYEWFQTYPVGILIPSTTEAETIEDLVGLRVGVPGRFGASYTGLTAVLSVNELAESDIQLETIGFNAPDVVCLGAIEAATIYVNNEPLQIQNRAEQGECGDISDVRVLPVADYADMVSNGITTSEAVIAEDPERVAAVTNAFDRGLRRVINNPAAAYLTGLDFVENLPASAEFVAALESAAAEFDAFLETGPDMEAVAARRAALFNDLSERFAPDELIQFEVLLETITLWEGDVLGQTEAESWSVTQDILLEIGALTEAIELDAAYTNRFVPALEE